MSETQPRSGGATEPAPPRKKGGKKLILLGGVVLLLGGGAAAAWLLVPNVSQKAQTLAGHAETATGIVASTKPVFVDLPEMALTLPNNGKPRQMRIKLSLELAHGGTEKGSAELLTPRVYDESTTRC